MKLLPIQCMGCNHFNGGVWEAGESKWICSAYPDGIPQNIATGIFSHRFPYRQNNKVVFSPIESTKEG